MKKASVTLIFFLINSIFFGCASEEISPNNRVDCPTNKIYGKITELTANVGYVSNEIPSFTTYHIKLDFSWEKAPNNFRNGLSFGAELNACTPAPPVSVSGLDTVFVITLKDYNANYSANDTINNFIRPTDQEKYYPNFENYMSLHRQNFSLNTHFIYFAEPPFSDRSLQQFKIIYKFENGEIFEATTPEHYISL